MTFRRRSSRPARFSRPARPRGKRPLRRPSKEVERPAGLLPEEEQILGFLYTRRSATAKELADHLGLGRQARGELPFLLQRLCRQKLLACKGESFRLKNPEMFLEGTVSMHPRGFGFATATKAGGNRTGRDLFLPPPALSSARHGDRVLLVVTGQRQDRLEARVVRVLERASNRLVGTYMGGGRTGLVTPEDERYPFTILVRKENALGAADDMAVVVEITDHPEGGHPEGRIVEVLGDPGQLGVQTEIVIRKFDLPHAFSREALEQTGQMSEEIREEPGRQDLREVFHVTIDGEDARDFDDAVSVETTEIGYRLLVSIADVSHYVKVGTPLDLEAYQRGTSVYFPTRVIPMLPERLSNDLCSLVPRQDRLAFTAILDFDRQGNRLGKKFTRSIIRSRHRLTYTTVKKLLVDQDKTLCRQYPDLTGPLDRMAELARRLMERRRQRGSIGFEIPEARVLLGPDDTVAGVARLERNFAHQLIEEFMLAANEAVAATFAEQQYPALYRIHEVPDAGKVLEFAEFARSMGLELPPDVGSPKWFGKVLDLVAGTPIEYIVNNLLLRTMKQAAYSPDNVGHFGLAAPYYTHFTSPIRRYPDLMIHRALQQLLTGTSRSKTRSGPQPLPEAGDFLSARERIAVDADREMVDRLKVRFMAGKIGEEFDGVISGVAQFGLFVELLDNFVSGGIAVADLKDDYYHLDEKRHRYLGERTGRIFQMGDLVRVRVAGVNLRRRRIDFELVEKRSAVSEQHAAT